MTSRTPSRPLCNAALAIALLLTGSHAWGQAGGVGVVSALPPPALTVKRGEELQLPLSLVIRGGYHVNSNKPAEDYLIPTALTWNTGPLSLRGVAYPKAETVKYEFSAQPLSVYSGMITLTSRFAAPADAPRGPFALSGKLRYQACTDKLCLPPKTLEVSVPLTIQ